MKSALWKDTIREIRKSLGRFLSIFAIVAIGVAFFAGVKAAVPDMKYTADQYFDKYRLEDIQIASTIGFTKEDVSAIQATKGVEGVMAVHNMNALTTIDKQQLVMAVHGLPKDLSEDNKNYLNRANVIEGRLPKQANECLIEQGKLGAGTNVKIGDTITLSSGTDTDISQTLSNHEFKVVGFTLSPYYLSYQKGTTDIGDGSIHNFMLIPDENFTSEYYTEMNITVAGARSLNAYDDAYFDVIKPVKKRLEKLADTRIEVRIHDIQEQAKEQLAQQVSLYETSVIAFQEGIASAQTKLANTKTQLTSSRAMIKQQRADLETNYQTALQQIADGEALVQQGMAQYNQAKVELDERFKNEINPGLLQLQTELKQNQDAYLKIRDVIGNCRVDIEKLQSDPVTNAEKILQLQEQLAIYEATVSDWQSKITTQQNEIARIGREYQAAQGKLASLLAQLESQTTTLATARTQATQGKADGTAQLDAAAASVKRGWKEYHAAVQRVENEKTYGQQELDVAGEKLQNAEKSLDILSQPKWYTLDRHSQYSYMDYGSAADRMDAIAKVFPIFFFIVAALVCLTTMTRMVDEQRSATGILKALGYGKFAIASKYVAYAASASILGSIVGCLVGMTLFPTVIFNAWALMYALPTVQLTPQIPLALLATGIAVSVTTIAAFLAVYKELVETPSLLMRPKAPKNGKKIFLERITVIWKHFSFTEKVTARNIFRYKKRFLMTVIGISGCTALLLSGFGIRDSISQVVSKQYGEIFQYDVSIGLENNTSFYQKHVALSNLEKDKRVKSIMPIAQYNATVQDTSDTVGVTLVIPSDTKTFQKFTSLHERSSQDRLPFSDKGAIISEKLANQLAVKQGDTILVNNGTHQKVPVKITGITENYINHYVYVSPAYYHDLFQETASDNMFIAILKKTDAKVENTLGQDLTKMPEVKSVVFFSGIADSFNDTISSLSFVTLVLVISAGILAFVVLYNLTNVNVSERLREIATIKVLGFYDKEVSAYVYRENIILSIIGAICGLGLGVLLHRLIMSVAEMDAVMFGRNVEPLSYVYAVVITIGFALIVNLAMYPKLKKIPMVESLKSIE